MIYGKLPVLFLGAVSSEKNGSTNSIIANFILEHQEQVKNMGITELAEICHVSASSVSRFCKDVGLTSYAELREILDTKDLETDFMGDARQISHSIELVSENIDRRMLRQLCREIKEHKKVAAFGLLKAHAAAVNLQCDLLMQGKMIYTHVSQPQQTEHILSADRDDLIIIFSATGSYFEYQDLRNSRDRLKAPRIWMISGEDKSFPSFVDEKIIFPGRHKEGGHPYQLLTAASLIAREYTNI